MVQPMLIVSPLIDYSANESSSHVNLWQRSGLFQYFLYLL